MANLPLSVNPIVGRGDDLRLLSRLVADNRLITLVGPGGVGKTSLAAEAAHEAEPEFDRVISVRLVNAETTNEVASTISAAVFGEPADDLALVIKALSSSSTLLVLDNCEQAVEPIGDAIQEILAGSRSTHILATSRRPLELAGEVVFGVKPLAVPVRVGNTNVIDFPSVQLFIERVRQADPTFTIDDENVEIVADICSRADGIPLVLELAAALVRTRPLTEILQAMSDTPAVLEVGRRDLYDHQRSVMASLEWSRRFLSDDERTLLGQLSCFAGSFTIAAVRQVCETTDDRNLMHLVDHSLVVFDPETDRYRLLEIIRDDARLRLDDDEREANEQRFLDWCAVMSQEIGDAMTIADPEGLFPKYDHEIVNLEHGLARCWERGETKRFIAMLAPMAMWWTHYARPSGVRHWDQLMDQATEDQAMRLSLALAFYWSHRGEFERSLSVARFGLELAQGSGDSMLEAVALLTIGNSQVDLGDTAAGIGSHRDALAVAEQAQMPYAQLLARLGLARIEPDRAKNHLEGSIEVAAGGFTVIEALLKLAYVDLALNDGHLHEATALVDEAYEATMVAGFPEGISTALAKRAMVHEASGRIEEARADYQAALEMAQQIFHVGAIATAQAGLDALPEFSVKQERVRLDGNETLSDREIEVLRLLRGDLTQREIADELYIAASTVKTHIKSIYRKMGVSKRSYAITRGGELGFW